MIHAVTGSAVLRKDCSNSTFSSFPLSTYLLSPAAMKLLEWAHAEVVSCFFLHSSASLFERGQGLIMGFAASQSAQIRDTDTRIRDCRDSSALQIFVCVHSFYPPDNCTLCVWSNLSRGPLCTNTFTLLHLAHCPEHKPVPKTNIFVKYSCHKTCLGISQMFGRDISSKKNLKPEAILTFQSLKLRID